MEFFLYIEVYINIMNSKVEGKIYEVNVRKKKP